LAARVDTEPTAPGAVAPPSGRTFGHAEVFAAIFALGFLAARLLPLLELRYECPFKALTGLPCAACGMTHAFVHLAHGAVGAAFDASPLGAAAAALAWLFVAGDAVRLTLGMPMPTLPPRAARALAGVGLIAVLANWVFLVIAHRA
jgi:Protein of unknown function (DUF2752)